MSTIDPLLGTFVAIDSEAFGEGDDDALPLDAWLQRRIDSNISWIATMGDGLSYPRAIGDSADDTDVVGSRPLTAISSWATLWLGVIHLRAGQSGLSVVTMAQISSIASTMPGTVQTRFRCIVDGEVIGESLGLWTDTHTGGTTYVGQQAHTLGFTGGTAYNNGPQKDTLALLVLECKMVLSAEQSMTNGASSDGTGAIKAKEGAFAEPSTDGTLFADITSGNPTTNSLETAYFTVDSANLPNYGQDAHYNDLLWGKNTDTNAAGLLKPAPSQYADPSATYTGETKYGMTVSLRSIIVRPLHTYGGRMLSNWLALRPNIPLTSASIMRQAQRIRSLVERPRLIYMGPPGGFDSDADAYWDKGYSLHWPFVLGSEAEKSLIDVAVWLDTENPEIEFHCYFICSEAGVVVGSAGQYNVDTIIRITGESDARVTFGPQFGRALWDLTFSLQKMDDVAAGTATWASNATTYGEETFTDEALDLYPASARPSGDLAPVLRTQGWAHEGSKSSGRAGAFCYKEGHLFGGLGDFTVIQRRTYRIRVADMVAGDCSTPFRLKVSAVHANAGNASSSEPQNDYLDPQGTPQNATRLTLCSITAIEHPVIP